MSNFINECLKLLARPEELYAQASDETRRKLNQAIFKRIFVMNDEVVGHEMVAPLGELLAAQTGFEAAEAGLDHEAVLRQAHAAILEHDPKIARAARNNQTSWQTVDDLLTTMDRGDASSNPFLVRLLGRYLNSKTEVDRITRLCKRAASEHVERVSPTTVRGPARLTKQQNERIVALYKAGRRPVDIARELETTEWTVHHRLNRLGVERRPISMTNIEIQEALRLNDEGVPITELTKQFNRSWNTIQKELRMARGH